MNPRTTIAAFVIVVHAEAMSASPPAPAPNFCTYGLCLEISQLSDQVIETRTKDMLSEILIQSHDGTTKLIYSPENVRTCTSPTGIQLRKVGAKFVGGGCLALPNEESHWRYVSLEYVPVLSPGPMVEVAILNFPILHFWSVDTAPASFWKFGYALRVGEGVSVTWTRPVPRSEGSG